MNMINVGTSIANINENTVDRNAELKPPNGDNKTQDTNTAGSVISISNCTGC